VQQMRIRILLYVGLNLTIIAISTEWDAVSFDLWSRISTCLFILWKKKKNNKNELNNENNNKEIIILTMIIMKINK